LFGSKSVRTIDIPEFQLFLDFLRKILQALLQAGTGFIVDHVTGITETTVAQVEVCQHLASLQVLRPIGNGRRTLDSPNKIKDVELSMRVC